MNNSICPLCKGKMKRNGKTKAGTQRWYCPACLLSTTHKYDNKAKRLEEFLSWLMSKEPQTSMPGAGRTFRRRTAEFWELWPQPPVVDEVFRAVYVDGIWISRNIVVLIACSDDHVLGWYLARSESAESWRALLSRIAPPDMVVTDGGSGFAAAVAAEWPGTKVQRCTFHVFCQVKRQTTSRPKLDAGKELYQVSKALLKVRDTEAAAKWLASYAEWASRWDSFLKEYTLIDGRREYTHQRLRKARGSINRVLDQGAMFTFLDDGLTGDGPLPAMNNMIEGAVNAQLRHMLQEHRGMSAIRRIKAVFWWCYLHCEYQVTPAEILRTMPTDNDIEGMYATAARSDQGNKGAPGWGNVAVWNEFHTAVPWRQ